MVQPSVPGLALGGMQPPIDARVQPFHHDFSLLTVRYPPTPGLRCSGVEPPPTQSGNHLGPQSPAVLTMVQPSVPGLALGGMKPPIQTIVQLFFKTPAGKARTAPCRKTHRKTAREPTENDMFAYPFEVFLLTRAVLPPTQPGSERLFTMLR